MEGIHPLFFVVILLFGVIILSILKLQKATPSKSFPSERESKKDTESTETPFSSPKLYTNHPKIPERLLLEDHQETNLVKSQSQPLIVSPKQPIGEIVKIANDLYSAADIQVHDANTRGRIQKTIARARAKHNPLYKFLVSEDELTDNDIDSSRS